MRVCVGESMAPTVRAVEAVSMAHGNPRLRSGQVVLFAGAGDFEVLHRLLFKVPWVPYFVHRGDAEDAKVGLARWDRIVGSVDLPRRRVSVREMAEGAWLVARSAGTRVRAAVLQRWSATRNR